MRTYKNKSFARFARHAGIPDAALCDAVLRAGRGQVDADLGGGVIKQRIARAGGGRSGGFRAIVLFRREDRAFFVHGFAKNERENLQRDELRTLRRLAGELFGLERMELEAMLANGTISEVNCDDKAI
ncbi:type II toxin-antitoxin system RelE/ParE family toxin [Methylobacterium sp.]|uniref:type II toxin-antitoxin system RelE/ParE family toxin n=1 Tax=Methylobacterium sp. TaxID=409 RepID=UPI003B5B1AB1